MEITKFVSFLFDINNTIKLNIDD
ncbi:hypothetical protein MNBD_GAMMA10-593 [hydrothermal vent metagenome]|uniref:Uncharacterized protein n=1 Tax=hydrothermal vent metagenome TaxID=652676 RepID=A0A3B0X8I6_9ZZZZ